MIEPNPADAPDAVTKKPGSAPPSFLRIVALWLTMGLAAGLMLRYLPVGLRFRAVRLELDQLILWGVNLSIVSLALAAWYVARYVVASAWRLWQPNWKLIGAKDRTVNSVEASRFLTDSDVVLTLTEPVHRYLAAHPRVVDRLLMVSSVLLDQLCVFILLCGIVGSSLRTCLGLGIVVVVPQLCRALIALPPPMGMIWRDPDFPSVFVNYSLTNNVFLSDRTALTVYGALALAGLTASWVTAVAVAIALVQSATALALRTNYTVDVIAGGLAALFAASAAPVLTPVVF